MAICTLIPVISLTRLPIPVRASAACCACSTLNSACWLLCSITATANFALPCKVSIIL
ncbi:Uncharacterised protein [Vibrio cholerae]|nr:Uncharacterised protein [Vibrio cholerae]